MGRKSPKGRPATLVLAAGKKGPMAFMVSSVASATPRLPDSDVALENWFFQISCAARRAALRALLLRDGGAGCAPRLGCQRVKLASVPEIKTGCYLRLDRSCGDSRFL